MYNYFVLIIWIIKISGKPKAMHLILNITTQFIQN